MNGSGGVKTQEVLVLTADSMLSTHCKERPSARDQWMHRDGGARWRVVQDTLLWWWGDAPDANARRCHFELTNNQLNLSCKKSSEGMSPMPAGVYERADSLKLEP